MKKKVFRIMSIFIIAALILVIVTLSAGAIAKSNLAKQYPAPGQLVDVGGYKLHIYCTGQGSPTVILDAGLMEFSVNWAYVQPEIATTNRVCSYDRAGYGWSDPSPNPRTASTEAEELHTLLVNANLQGPYVLVGHSLGGMLVRVYAHNYPDEVIGMVLVDSTHEEQNIRFPASLPKLMELQQQSNKQMTGQFQMFGLLSSTGMMAFAQKSIPDPGLPEAAYAQYQARLVVGRFFETGIAEFNMLDEMLAEVRAMNISSFGELPLIVLSAGQWVPNPATSETENQQLRELAQTLQAELVSLSSQGKQVIVEKSGHNIQSEQPGYVVDAIREIMDALPK